MLDLGRTFTRAQTAYLMSYALRQGSQAATDGAWREGYREAKQEPVDLFRDALSRAREVPEFSERALRLEGYRQRARREADIAAAHPWHGDHPGGPVLVWEMPEHRARAEARDRTLAAYVQVDGELVRRAGGPR